MSQTRKTMPQACGEQSYHSTKMQKEIILAKLKEQGCRITKQRRMLLDIIMDDDCSCCKEIFYKASKYDKNIGTATVYRMINTLEDIGAISRKNMYKIACGSDCKVENACTISFEDNSHIDLAACEWHKVIEAGLAACGYSKDKKIKSVTARTCNCEK